MRFMPQTLRSHGEVFLHIMERSESETDMDSIYLLACLLTYLLTPWSRVLLEKVTGFQLVKEFRTFCGTPKFITEVTSARHLSLS